MSFKDRFINFFRGIYGNDQLNTALICLYFAAVIIGSFTGSKLILLIETALFALTVFRMFSKKIHKRRAENEKFMKLYGNVKKKIKQAYISIRDINKYRYRNCPKCHARLRLTKKRGKHTVKCPLCENEFDVRII